MRSVSWRPETTTSHWVTGQVPVQPDGQLGTLEPDQFRGPAGPTGPQGPAGAGLVRGSLLLLSPDASPPAGYVFIGTTQLTTQLPPKKPSVTKVNVYVMQ